MGFFDGRLDAIRKADAARATAAGSAAAAEADKRRKIESVRQMQLSYIRGDLRSLLRDFVDAKKKLCHQVARTSNGEKLGGGLFGRLNGTFVIAHWTNNHDGEFDQTVECWLGVDSSLTYWHGLVDERGTVYGHCGRADGESWSDRSNSTTAVERAKLPDWWFVRDDDALRLAEMPSASVSEHFRSLYVKHLEQELAVDWFAPGR